MADQPTYTLDWRFLSAIDAPRVERFSCGEEWWSHEVTDFLRNDALEMATAGFNQTILFSLSGERDIAGFMTVASDSLKLTDTQLAFPATVAPPTGRLPAAIIPYFGVARQLRGMGIGLEMHTLLLRAIGQSWAGTRVIYLQCWEENTRGIAFWNSLGYQEFGRRTKLVDGVEQRLVSLLLDLFAMPEVPA